MSEVTQVQRAIAGDAEALAALWRAHRRWVAAVLLAHRPRGVDLEDLLQEVAVRVLQKIAELRDPERLRPWLAAVARNVARMEGRRVGTRLRAFGSASMSTSGRDEQGSGDVLQIVDPAAEKEHRRQAARETLDQTLEAVRSLPLEFREPLLLRSQGLSQKQIAETLELPETTVETRLARARRKLRRVCSEAEAGPRRHRRVRA